MGAPVTKRDQSMKVSPRRKNMTQQQAFSHKEFQNDFLVHLLE
jgi:hypothetical protein